MTLSDRITGFVLTHRNAAPTAIVIFGIFILMLAVVVLTIPPAVPPSPTILKPPNPTLLEWTYRNSRTISRQTCQAIVREAEATGKPEIVLAIILAESDFVPTAVSKKGAIGLMQVMFEAHQVMLIKYKVANEKRDLFDISASIKAGNMVLEMYLKECNGDVSKALDKYLAGIDGAYKAKIYTNLANLYVLTNNKR